MKSHVRAAVIGGGVVGASVLYHLTKRGWTDVALYERSELTSGSTWHAAGGMHTLNGDPNVAKLQKYTIELYREIEELSGQATGVHITGGLLLADTPERMDWLKMAHARGRYLGLESELISAAEAKARMPMLDDRYFVGALWEGADGHLDPYGVTHAYAKAARAAGAQVHLHTKIEDLRQNADGGWTLSARTKDGDAVEIVAEHVVNAAGLWAREVGRMAGLELPILAMEHMYILTEAMPEVAEINAATGKEVMHCIDFGGEIYMRQERDGMLMGTYERAGKPWSEKATPWDFGHELLAPDLDRIAPSLEIGFQHFPAFQNAGIRKIVNGPFTFAPDGNPMVGPVRGRDGLWLACGVMAGFSQGGGVGLALANWMTDGDPGFDVWAMDAARYGDWATLAYTNAKVRENYSRRFRIRFPNEELPAARPLKTTPIYDRLIGLGAVMGDSWGLEAPLWFADSPEAAKDVFSFKRSTDFEAVGAEARAVRETVGLSEISNFAKYEITGRDAAAWLDRLLACRLPAPGRMTLAPMLNPAGKVIGDFTLANLGRPTDAREGGDRYFLVGSGIAEQYHMRWFLSQIGPDEDVTVAPWGLGLVGLSVAGPKARDVLIAAAEGAHVDLSAAAFGFMEVREADIGPIPARIARVSYTGDLGYEIWVRPEYQRALFERLYPLVVEAGGRLFGARALNALRLEKSFGSWAREFRPLYSPVECGLDRFVAWKKPTDFIGRTAAEADRAAGGARRLSTFVVDAGDADVIGDEPIWRDGAVVGWVTSGGYAHASNASVALGYVPREMAETVEGWEIEILGERRAATLRPEPLFDANGGRMRG